MKLTVHSDCTLPKTTRAACNRAVLSFGKLKQLGLQNNMPFAPGQSGNPAGRPKRAKLWQEAILRAIKRRENEDPQALEKLADALIRKVEDGDVAAIKELGDRMDGKVAQAIIGGDEDDEAVKVVHRIERVIVSPTDQDR